MKVKRVLRYYCEFCKKSGGGKAAMIKHEEHCTMNPNRICGLCNGVYTDADLPDMIALLPDPEEYQDEDATGKWYTPMLTTDANVALGKIRELTECPACILSAIRQRGIPVPVVSDFNYQKESEAYLSERDNEPEREVYYGI